MPDSDFATRPEDHRFFTFMTVFSAVLITIGFGSTYGVRLREGPGSVPLVIHLHALAFSAWLVVLVAQARLAAKRRLATHRRVGTAAAALAVVMLALGVAAAVASGRRGHRGLPGAEFDTPAGFTLFSLLAVMAFFSLMSAAVWFRAKPQAHKRLVLMATVGALLPPGMSRIPGLSGHLEWMAPLSTAFLLAGPVYDLATRRRVHPAYFWGALPVIATFPPLVARLAQSSTWQAIARAWLE